MIVGLLLASLLPGYVYDHHDWLNLPAMDRVVSITSDNYHGYVAVSRGVYEIDRSSRKLTRTYTAIDGLQGRVLAAGFDLASNLLWVLSTGNLASINTFSGIATSYSLPDAGANSLGIAADYIYLDADGRLFRLAKRSGTFDTTSAGSDRVRWYGARTDEQPSDYPFLTPYVFYDNELRGHAVTTVFRDGRRLWVGTDGYGVLLYSISTTMPIAQWQFGPAFGRVRSIFSSEGSLWFAGDEMLARYSPIRDTWSYFATPFNAIYLDSALLLRSELRDLERREGILAVAADSSGSWLGTSDGIYFYAPGGSILTELLRLKARANAVHIDRDSVFVGTDNGLVRYDRRSGEWSLFADSMQQMHFGAFGIASTARQRYYAVYGGIETQDSLGEWELLIPPGWPLSQHPTALAATADRLFIGTDQGVIVYHERTGSYLTLDTGSGLLSNRVSSLYADADFLWIATDAGLSRFNYHSLFP